MSVFFPEQSDEKNSTRFTTRNKFEIEKFFARSLLNNLECFSFLETMSSDGRV